MKFAIFLISSTLLDREVFELITDTGSASVMGTFESKINFSCFSRLRHYYFAQGTNDASQRGV